jgi:hypothetical protein
MDQSVKVRLHPGERRSVKTGRRVREGSCFLSILFHLYSKHLNKDVLEGLETSNIGGQVIRNVQYADDHVLLAKEATANRT